MRVRVCDRLRVTPILLNLELRLSPLQRDNCKINMIGAIVLLFAIFTFYIPLMTLKWDDIFYIL